MKDDMQLEMIAGRNIQLGHIKEIMKENIPQLLAENQRLKEQLDREIKINRKMKRALEKYADPFNDMQPINELAQQVLKEIGEEE